jgi:HK97 family phage major capsid protein
MSELVNRLRDRRANVWEQAKELADRAAEENRSFSGEEQRQWDEANAELDALDSRIKSVLEGEARAKDTEEQFDKIHGARRSERRREPVGAGVGAREASGGGGGDASDVGTELRAFLRGESGRSYTVAPTQGLDIRSLVKGTNASGGFLVPTTFYDRLIQHLIETSGVLQTNPTVINTSSGEIIQIPKTTAHYTATIVTEASSIPASESVFGQVPLGAYKYGALFQISRELLDDNGVDLEGYLSMNAGRALGNAMGAHFITGTGTGQPSGILAGATGAVTGATGVGGVPTTDNLIDLYYSVISPYRASRSASWLMNDTTVGRIRKLKDPSGAYIWQPSLVAGTPDTILGKPVYTDPYVATAATGAKSIVFGDFSQYFVRLAGGVRFERSDEYSFDKDLVTFRALMRADGCLVDLSGAIKYYVGAGT